LATLVLITVEYIPYTGYVLYTHIANFSTVNIRVWQAKWQNVQKGNAFRHQSKCHVNDNYN